MDAWWGEQQSTSLSSRLGHGVYLPSPLLPGAITPKRGLQMQLPSASPSDSLSSKVGAQLMRFMLNCLMTVNPVRVILGSICS